jgi:hypothetical protein
LTSASFASWSPMFYEVKRRLPRKPIGGALRRPRRAWPLSDPSIPSSCTMGRTSTPVYRASGCGRPARRRARGTHDRPRPSRTGTPRPPRRGLPTSQPSRMIRVSMRRLTEDVKENDVIERQDVDWRTVLLAQTGVPCCLRRPYGPWEQRTGQPGAWSTCTVVKYNEGQWSWPVPRLRCGRRGGTLLYRG